MTVQGVTKIVSPNRDLKVWSESHWSLIVKILLLLVSYDYNTCNPVSETVVPLSLHPVGYH